jgi:ParB/RepB/Spo0J family partition protein
MKSTDTESLSSEAPAPAGKFQTPNADGIFENAEQIYVPMAAGCICHFLVAETAHGFVPGFKFFTRQPRNQVESLPSVNGDAFKLREAALAEAFDAATKFFSDHKDALKRLATWGEGQPTLVQFFALSAEGLVRDGEVVPALPKAGWTLAALVDAKENELKEFAGDASDPQRAEAARKELNYRRPFCVDVEGAADFPPADPIRSRFESIAVDDIEFNANPRKNRTAAKLAELTASIKGLGEVLHPIAVRDMGEDRPAETKRYQGVFGEGRWLAVQELGWTHIDAKVYTGVNAADVLARALVENLMKEDMNAIDEAEGFADLKRMGWTAARMSEQTGKSDRTIRRAIGLMKLPEATRALVRSEELSARQARELAKWVSDGAGDEGKGSADFVARPGLCEIIGNVASKSSCNISSDELADGIPEKAISALVSAKELIEINGSKYYDELCARNLFALAPETGKYFTIGDGAVHLARLYCWPETDWAGLKKTIDKEVKDAAAARAAKAATRVEVAQTAGVNVNLGALKESKTEHVVLTGALEIYAEHLPEEIVATGIDPVTKAEVAVCTQPAKLQLLRNAEARAIGDDKAAKIEAADDQARSKLAKVKRLGAREMAFVMEATQCSGNGTLDEFETWEAAGLKHPKNWQKLSLRQLLETLEPAEQFRLFVTAQLNWLQLEPLAALLRWILEVPKLGLIEEDPREREKLLKRLAAELFAGPKPAAFESRESGVIVDFPDRSEAQAYVNEQAGRHGFAAYEVAIEKTGKTYCIRYSIGTKEVKERARAAIDAGAPPMEVALKFGLSVRDPALDGTKKQNVEPSKKARKS